MTRPYQAELKRTPAVQIPSLPDQLADWVLDWAREAGAEYPTLAESSEDEPVIVDTSSGRVWRIQIKEIK